MKDKYQFYYVGNLYPHKNIINLINAFALLDAKYLLTIFSNSSPFITSIKEVIDKNSLDKRVKILLNKSDKELCAIVKNMWGLVYPSLEEGFGLQGIEAMKVGVLVICSDIPVFKEVYQNNAIYFDPANIDEIAKKIKIASELNNSEYQKKVSQALKFVKRYNWETTARQTLKVYEESCNCV